MKIKLNFVLVLLLLCHLGYAQLSNFTLTVTATNETCTANGALNFSVSNTVPGSTIVYSVYLLPNTTTPIATLSANTYGGLVAGNYSVVATQTLGSQSGSQQQNVTISNQIVPLVYGLSGQNNPCTGNGQITVNVTSGTAVSYEIFSGPVIKPLQTSNVFTGLTSGTYQIRVFDNCGEGVVQTYTLMTSGAGLQISNQIMNPPLNCSTVLVSHILSGTSSGTIAYPLTVVCTVFPPGGGTPIVYNQTITTGSPNSQTYSQNIALFANQSYTYNLSITDACGNVYVRNNNNANSNTTPVAQVTPLSCNVGQVFIRVVQAVVLVSAPSAYPNSLPHNYSSGIALGSVVIQNLPPGNYTFNATDVCGTVHVLNITLNPPPVQNPTFSVREGCDENSGSVMIKSENGAMVSILMTEAPPAYTVPLPQNVSFNINSNGVNFMMNSLPVGQYKFHFTDVCGNQFDVTMNLQGFQMPTNTFAITENCSSFNLELHHTNNSPFTNTFWLQEYNSTTNQWMHPGTGVVYVPGTELTPDNAVSLANNSINSNLAYSGNFRIILGYKVYGNGVFESNCFRVLGEFEFDGLPKIDDVYSFSCNNATSDVIVEATGLGPLLYRITAKNGQPFLVENGTSNVFLGLQPAIYNFQVEDNCGNILNGIHDITNPFTFQISATDFCEGQTASLAVASFPFLTYQWWEASNPSVILSTTSELLFPSYNSVNNQGTYVVSIINPGNFSCIDQTLSYVVNPNLNNPNAGIDGSMSECGIMGLIDLFTLLSGNYDLNGVWTAMTPVGALTNNFWDGTGTLPGVYQFKYTVTGFCNAVDESMVTITINPVPQTPMASVSPVVCDTHSLELFATLIPNASYQWTGPNGFFSNLQNPIIDPVSPVNNGIYTVKAIQNGCESDVSSVEVEVGTLPQFAMEFKCIDNIATLSAQPINNSFNIETAEYLWSNAQGFSSSDNPVSISGEAPGIYTLTITNPDGCSTTDTMDVATTLCSIPNGISPNNDGLNDAFDLSGFTGITQVKIFNRYGMVVFEQENYVNEWKGQDKQGNLLPTATYYYLVNLENNEIKSGWVYLMREND